MSLLLLIGISLLVGFLLWLLQTKVTIIDATVKQIIVVGVIIVWVVWVLQQLGFWQALSQITI